MVFAQAAVAEPQQQRPRRGGPSRAKERREKFWTGQHWQRRRNWHQDPNVYRYPEDRARVSDEASVVAALARSSKGITRITVSLNGAEVHQQS